VIRRRNTSLGNGLRLVLDEFVRQLRDSARENDELDMRHTTLAAAVQLRLTHVSPKMPRPRLALPGGTR
jgi:hypothetical protein